MQVQGTQFADRAFVLATEPANPAPPSSANDGNSRAETASPSGSSAGTHQVSVSVADGQVFVYRILDEKTGDLIQQIPPDEILRLIRSIQQMLQETERPAGIDIQT
jgi:FlaG protein